MGAAAGRAIDSHGTFIIIAESMKNQLTRREAILSSCLAAAAGTGVAQQSLVSVKAKRKPPDEWKTYPTRTLSQLSGFIPGSRKVKYSKYGGWLDDPRGPSVGFFRPTRRGERWWLIDPDGYLYLNVGVCSVAPGKSEASRARFDTPQKWADETTKLLAEHHFSATGGWSDVEHLRGAPHRLVYAVSSNFMSSFGRQKHLTFQQPGHTGYANDCIPVFHPEFESFCDEYARSLAATKDDPYLLGHFSDNELPVPVDLLDKSLALDTMDPRTVPGYNAARKWLKERRGGAEETSQLSDQEREAFREFVFGRYFEITARAIRKHDPNHLCLGSRLHSNALRSPAIFRAAGKHLDVIAVNLYNQWTPPAEMLAMWHKEAAKPVIITEFYTKGDDAGFKNTSGAGWIVPTQKDRALFYQNFTLALLESRECVGWHWFKYMDNDPEDLTTDPSNRDSNKGIVSIRYEPYRPLLEGMKALNSEVYALTEYFDRG
jgi:hypothetical protein